MKLTLTLCDGLQRRQQLYEAEQRCSETDANVSMLKRRRQCLKSTSTKKNNTRSLYDDKELLLLLSHQITSDRQSVIDNVCVKEWNQLILRPSGQNTSCGDERVSQSQLSTSWWLWESPASQSETSISHGHVEKWPQTLNLWEDSFLRRPGSAALLIDASAGRRDPTHCLQVSVLWVLYLSLHLGASQCGGSC